jgi:hypothetical protein
MHRAHLLPVLAIALGLSGCVLKKTPVAKAAPPPPKPTVAPAPAPPPEPLSLPQTTVVLPPAQPLSQEAILTTQPPEETPVPAPPPRTGSRPSRQNNAGQQKPPEPVPPPVVAPPAANEPERPPLQEMLTGPERQRLLDETTTRKTEAIRLVDQAKRRRLTRQQNGTVERIQQFIKQANDAEQRGDLRQASELADRALVLARELKP